METGEYNGWKVVEVPIEELHDAEFEPVDRLSDDQNLRTLRKSIQERGVLVPILIKEDGTIIDGHRRTKCARELVARWEVG